MAGLTKQITKTSHEEHQAEWEVYLDTFFCKADPETLNRPCDFGIACNICQTKTVERSFKRWRANNNRRAK